MKTIKDVEEQLKERLSDALEELNLNREGYDYNVRLHGKTRDKKSNASFEKSWDPYTDTIRIEFQLTEGKTQAPSRGEEPGITTSHIDSASQSSAPASDPLSDLIRALDHAESLPGYNFVALKWFRDTALPKEGFAWASDYSARQMALRDAIDKRLVLKSQVANPKSPQYPVTSIRLNRLMPKVKEILGIPDDRLSDFQPVPIRGENLSQTVLSDRR